jgi:tRNA A37 threonylcarbamoyladenosine dehydratase
LDSGVAGRRQVIVVGRGGIGDILIGALKGADLQRIDNRVLCQADKVDLTEQAIEPHFVQGCREHVVGSVVDERRRASDQSQQLIRVRRLDDRL